jgi:hypothetical protein
MNRFLSQELTIQILQKIRNANLPWAYDQEKHRFDVLDETGNIRANFRLPIIFPAPAPDLSFPEKTVHYVILLVQSGSCAIGYFENGINLDHKVFRAYMVRKKRGTSQIKHLKTKGKSRAGSRVRLAETLEFFENINERLQEYFNQHQIDRIALSCSKILIPYLFDSKTPTPFSKRDERIYKIPKHIHTPIYEVLLETHKFLLKGEMIYEENQQSFIANLLGE